MEGEGRGLFVRMVYINDKKTGGWKRRCNTEKWFVRVVFIRDMRGKKERKGRWEDGGRGI